MKWLCCQLGAREHYATPRALLRRQMLRCLVTDAWVPPSLFLTRLAGRKLADRFHSDLRDAQVIGFNSSLVLFEFSARVRRLGEWETIIGRNRWFQRKVVSFVRSHLSTLSEEPVLLSYSYAALEPFRYAKSQGWKTVLVQIDPGREEETIVAQEIARVPALAGEWQPAPSEYWTCWRQELDLADRVLVNSDWSREGLLRCEVPREKVSIVPLAYETSDLADAKSQCAATRLYPDRFTNERPMRVLFLGQVNLRKGAARLLEAVRMLRNEPVEFWIVGPVQIANAEALTKHAQVKWFGPVTRKQAAEMYRAADVFILPTLSDGFAITQLEAQAYGLPVIASKFCGQVVQSGRNGLILEEPSAECIAAAIRGCIADPSRLQSFAAESSVADEFTIDALAQRLQELGASL